MDHYHQNRSLGYNSDFVGNEVVQHDLIFLRWWDQQLLVSLMNVIMLIQIGTQSLNAIYSNP
jgi:hypothetical protein